MDNSKAVAKAMRDFARRERVRVKAAVGAGSRILAEDFARNAPKRTEGLAESARSSVTDSGSRITGIATVGHPGIDILAVEYGSMHQSPRPFFRKSVAETVPTIERLIVDAASKS